MRPSRAAILVALVALVACEPNATSTTSSGTSSSSASTTASASGAPLLQGLDEPTSLTELRATVIDPKGKPHELTAAPAKPVKAAAQTWPLRAQVLALDATGIGIAGGRTPLVWKTPPEGWLSEPGEYRVVLAGKLVAQDADAGTREMAWKSGPTSVRRRSSPASPKGPRCSHPRAADRSRLSHGDDFVTFQVVAS